MRHNADVSWRVVGMHRFTTRSIRAIACLVGISGCTAIDGGSFIIEHGPSTSPEQKAGFDARFLQGLRGALQDAEFLCHSPEEMNPYYARQLLLRCWGPKREGLFGLYNARSTVEVPRPSAKEDANTTSVRVRIIYGTVFPWRPPAGETAATIALVRKLVDRLKDGRKVHTTGLA